MTTAATIWPRNFTPGRSDCTSSTTPTTTTMLRPTVTPTMLTPEPMNSENGPGQKPASSHTYSTTSAVSRPRYMATPPRRGMGSLLTRRALGWSTMPCEMAIRLTRGTAATVTMNATAKTMR